jgi:hypothetical protein
MSECAHADPLPDPRNWKRRKRDLRLRKAVEALGLSEAERATVRLYVEALRELRASEAEYLQALDPALGAAPVPMPVQADRQDCGDQHRSRQALGDLREFTRAIERAGW